MATERINLASLTTVARAMALQEAGKTLASGGVVAMPTETVPGLFVRADFDRALQRFRAITNSPGGAWHSCDPERVIRRTGTTHPLHLRLIRRLAPGPVTFVLAHEGANQALQSSALGVPIGTVDQPMAEGTGPSRAILTRFPNHPVAGVVLAGVELGNPNAIVIGRAWNLDTADDRIAAVVTGDAVEGHPRPFGLPSTQLRLGGKGSFGVLHEGALPAWAIQDAATRHILFVCTGNTCRSPMAEAIARHELARTPPAIPTQAHSAGVAAGDGEPTTPEAIETLRLLGIAPPGHASHSLTREAIERADAVWTMTEAHRRQVGAMAPDAAPRIHTIDPSGDVPDPIGGSMEVYVKTADRLRALIRSRLRELDP